MEESMNITQGTQQTNLSPTIKYSKNTVLWHYGLEMVMGVFTIFAAIDRRAITHEPNTILTLIWIVAGSFIIQNVWFIARKDRQITNRDEYVREWHRASITYIGLCSVALAVLASLTRNR
jgi:hypothetical protein